MSQKPTTWSRKLSIWMNAVADAWNMGEAPWAYPEGRSLAVKLWNAHYQISKDEQLATELLVVWAQQRGIDPKRHKVSAR